MSTNANDIDPFADLPEDAMPTDSGLSRMSALYRRRREVEDKVEEAKAALKLASDEMTEIDERLFPALFDEVGVTSVVVDNHKIEVLEKLYGSFPSSGESRDEAMKRLLELGGENIMKATVSASYAKGDIEQAKQAQEAMLAAGIPASLAETIHAQTYQAWIREQLAAGVNLDLGVMGCYNRRFVKIT